MLTFKNVEDSIDTFSCDENKNVKQWIRDFNETTRLYQSIKKNDVREETFTWIGTSVHKIRST